MNYTNFTNLAAETISVGPPGQEENILTSIQSFFANDGLAALYEAHTPPAIKDFEALFGVGTTGVMNNSPFYYSIPFSAADIGKVICLLPYGYKLLFADERHATPAVQACTIQLEILSDGEAPGAGTNLLDSPLDLSLSANTKRSQSGNDDIVFDDDDAIAIKLVTGDATSFAGGHLFLYLSYVRPEEP